MSKALESIAVERTRQVEIGWTPDHDDNHDLNHLVNRAVVYAAAGRYESFLDPGIVREQLVKGAALLVAAIEHIDRREPGDSARLSMPVRHTRATAHTDGSVT